jgi:hypothetical protein
MSDTMDNIDAQFQRQSSSVSKIPKWLLRIIIGFIISLILIVGFRPRFVTDTKYDSRNNVCKSTTRYGKAVLYSLILTAPMYFVLKKYF